MYVAYIPSVYVAIYFHMLPSSAIPIDLWAVLSRSLALLQVEAPFSPSKAGDLRTP